MPRLVDLSADALAYILQQMHEDRTLWLKLTSKSLKSTLRFSKTSTSMLNDTVLLDWAILNGLRFPEDAWNYQDPAKHNDGLLAKYGLVLALDRRTTQHGFNFNRIAYKAAAEGQIKLLAWLSSVTTMYPDPVLMIRAMEGKQFETMSWLNANGQKWSCYTCTDAAQRNLLPALKHLHKNGHEFNSYTFDAAVGHGDPELIRWLHANQCPWSIRACGIAAKMGRIDTLSLLFELGCPFDESTCSSAAFMGELDALMYLRSVECGWTAVTCTYAAMNGHLELLKWARANGCPWNAETCFWAASNGQLECLQWAYANGCPWDERVLEYSRLNHRMHVYNWALENMHSDIEM